jgi:hypothetical protein
MLEKLVFYQILFILMAGLINLQPIYTDDRIDKMKEKIEEEKKKKEQEEEDEQEDDDDNGGCLGLGFFNSSDSEDEEEDYDSDDTAPSDSETTGCALGFFSLFTDIRFASYPYDPSCKFAFVGSVTSCPNNEKFGFLQLDLEGAYLFQETAGINAKMGFTLLLLRLQCFYQQVFSPNDAFTILSPNAGFTIPLGDGMVQLFAGIWLMDLLPESLFSFGAEITYFFPANLILDIYNLNAFYGSVGFYHFSCSISYALGNFSLGIGFNYNNYAEVVFIGPSLKLSLWI